jgi:hypothetical protein
MEVEVSGRPDAQTALSLVKELSVASESQSSLNLCTGGAYKSSALRTSHSILFDGENISFDVSLVIYIYIYK